ncbi:sterile alpha motif domain-containing protein 7 [Megalops cyprinoides]|uniref:sterile alpha motif domain-containing protein 7 n=1 Tax=Megalops cyprinoides TaxID=118141 RepID=UPI001863FDC4|nr:sterile alpha motif domain-containing protein 7 [Megalops cyprinoides]XP_036410555.1 sterile alpha motif domain-containing protein 7 [Megalops cyprinoides]
MTPREHLRKMTALGEQGPLDEKHWYRLVNGMSAGELRQRQELLMRNQMAMAPQLLAQGQQRLQGVPAQFEPRFMDRELVAPSEMVPTDARQIHMGPHLGPPLPPHSNVMPTRGFPGGGYGFLPSEPMETVARRQEMLHKQSIARMEMNAILHQKELESAHQKGLMGIESPVMFQGIPPNGMVFRGRQRLPEGHLPSDVFVHRTTLEDLQANSLLMSASPYPPISTLQRERGRRASRRVTNHKSADSNAPGSKGQSEDKSVEQSPGASGEEKEVEGKGESGSETASKPDLTKMDADLPSGSSKPYKDCESGLRKNGIISQDGCADGTSLSAGAGDKDMPNPCSTFHDKFLYPSSSAQLSNMPYMFPVPGSGLLPPGPNSVFLNGEDMSSVEDIRKWTVEDVYNFVNNIPSCSEYAQTFKDHMIDGETLPLLTEEHLLDTLSMKLGPALKVRSQVSRRMGSMFYMMNLPLAAAALQTNPEKAGDRSSEVSSPLNCNSVELLGSPCTRDMESAKPPEQAPMMDNPTPQSTVETA